MKSGNPHGLFRQRKWFPKFSGGQDHLGDGRARRIFAEDDMEFVNGAGMNKFPARFLLRKPALFDKKNLPPAPGEPKGGRQAGRAPAQNQDVRPH